jgi:hypothetical protein
MKAILIFALSLSCLTSAMGQLKAKVKCPDLYVDVINGTVNNQKPNYGWAEIKENIPCFTSAVDAESPSAKCGPAIFYKDKDVAIYTGIRRHYIEVGPKFVGKCSIPILGTKRGSLFRTLGNPKMKDDLWEAYETQYGTLILHYNVAGPAGKVIKFQMTTESTDAIQLCE